MPVLHTHRPPEHVIPSGHLSSDAHGSFPSFTGKEQNRINLVITEYNITSITSGNKMGADLMGQQKYIHNTKMSKDTIRGWWLLLS